MGRRAHQELQLPPGLRIRAGRFHLRFQVEGVEYAVTTALAATGRNLTAALNRLAEERQRVLAGEPVSRLVPRPFSNAADSFIDWARHEYEKESTVARLAVSMTSLKVFFEGQMVHQITPGAIEDYKSWRLASGIKKVTLRHDLHALSLLLAYGRKHCWLRGNPLEEVTIPSDKDAIRQYVLTEADEEIYFMAAAKFSSLYDLAKLMIRTGMRPEEAMVLRAEDVDLDGELVTIHGGKSRAARRTLALSADVVALLRPRVARGGWVFPGKGGRSISRLNGCHDKTLKAINKDRKPEDQMHFVLYDLRHTFATRAAEAGMPLALLKEILGHSDFRSLPRYVHPRQSSTVKAMRDFLTEKMSGFCPAPGSKQGDSGGLRQPAGEFTSGRRKLSKVLA